MKNLNTAFEMFKQNKTGSVKRDADSVFVSTKNALVMRRFMARSEATLEEILAVRIGAYMIGNSSKLDIRFLPDRAMVAPEQETLAQLVPMIPFSVMRQAGLSLKEYSELERGNEETLFRSGVTRLEKHELDALKKDSSVRNIQVVSKEERSRYAGHELVKYTIFTVEFERGQHFAGARLFKVSDRVFLLDVDRNELNHGIINPFLVELQDKSVKTIADAYQSLKPSVVVQAESDGLKVQRQGEWFLIPVTDELTSKRIDKALQDRLNAIPEGSRRGGDWDKRGELRAGNNRPNRAELYAKINGEHFVKGTLSHSGREHKDLVLKTWYKAMPNTSITSWQITGDLD